MSFTAGRESTNWEWFVDPVDHIISSLVIDGLSDELVMEVKDFCGYMGDNWVNWGILFGSFLTTSLASLDDDEREAARTFALGLPETSRGVDGALFDAVVSMEWMFANPNSEPSLKPLPLEEPTLFFMAAFCMLAGLFRMVRLPDGITPASVLVSIFVQSLQQAQSQQP